MCAECGSSSMRCFFLRVQVSWARENGIGWGTISICTVRLIGNKDGEGGTFEKL